MGFQVIGFSESDEAILKHRIQIVTEHSHRLVRLGGAGAGDDVERFLDPARVQQAPRHIGRDGAIGQLLGGVAGHVGVDIALSVRDVRQDDRSRGLLVAAHPLLG